MSAERAASVTSSATGIHCSLSLMTCFADIDVSQGSLARCSGSASIHLTTNLPRNFPVNIFLKNRLRLDRIMVMSLWPHFFWPTLYNKQWPTSKTACSDAG